MRWKHGHKPQLAKALTIQNKHLEDANVINHKNQILAEERKEKEKDRTKKIHPTILYMLKQAAATNPHDNNSNIAPSCLRFINSDNVGMVQFELTHQFASYRLDGVVFAAGTVQALHVGEFLYSTAVTTVWAQTVVTTVWDSLGQSGLRLLQSEPAL